MRGRADAVQLTGPASFGNTLFCKVCFHFFRGYGEVCGDCQDTAQQRELASYSQQFGNPSLCTRCGRSFRGYVDTCGECQVRVTPRPPVLSVSLGGPYQGTQPLLGYTHAAPERPLEWDEEEEEEMLQRALLASMEERREREEAREREDQQEILQKALLASMEVERMKEAENAIAEAWVREAEETEAAEAAEEAAVASIVQPRVTAAGLQAVQQPEPLSRVDAKTFAPREWLSDAAILWAYKRILTGAAENVAGLEADVRKAVYVIEPATVQSLKGDAQDAYTVAEWADEWKERALLLCPINDSRDTGRPNTGTHWTLLVRWKPPGSDTLASFSHYDSMGGLLGTPASIEPTWTQNFKEARKVANKIEGVAVEVKCGICAQQINGYDCGMYVLCFSKIIMQAFLDQGLASRMAGVIPGEEGLHRVRPGQVQECRRQYFEFASGASAAVAGGA